MITYTIQRLFDIFPVDVNTPAKYLCRKFDIFAKRIYHSENSSED